VVSHPPPSSSSSFTVLFIDRFARRMRSSSPRKRRLGRAKGCSEFDPTAGPTRPRSLGRVQVVAGSQPHSRSSVPLGDASRPPIRAPLAKSDRRPPNEPRSERMRAVHRSATGAISTQRYLAAACRDPSLSRLMVPLLSGRRWAFPWSPCHASTLSFLDRGATTAGIITPTGGTGVRRQGQRSTRIETVSGTTRYRSVGEELARAVNDFGERDPKVGKGEPR
jgi:hypothetical protein